MSLENTVAEFSFPTKCGSFDRHLRHDKHISCQQNMIYLMVARKKQQKNNRSTVFSLILVSVSRCSADSYTKPWCPMPLVSMHMIDHLVCPCTISSVSGPALGYFKFAPNLS